MDTLLLEKLKPLLSALLKKYSVAGKDHLYITGISAYDKLDDDFVKNYNSDTIFFDSILTEGADGGNCWDGEAEYFSTGDSAPEIPTHVEKLLHDLDIAISFKKIKDLKDNYIKVDHYTVPEYYGNYSNYEVCYISNDNLQRFLIENVDTQILLEKVQSLTSELKKKKKKK